MGSDSITPPPGFELDQPSASGLSGMTPPPGFELDKPSSPSLWDQAKLTGKMFGIASEMTPWSKAQEGLDNAGTGIAETAGKAGYPKTGAVLGTAVSRAAPLLATGSTFQDVPEIAEGVQSAGRALKSVFSNPASLADTGIRPTTVLKMTPKGTNPAAAGSDLESTLNQAGAIGPDASKTWDNVHALKEQAGQKVGSAIDAIRQQASQVGGADPLSVSADKALKPILDGWTERAGNATGIGRSYAQPFEDAHNYLSNIAQQKGGMVSMDDIKNVMDQVGPLTHKGAPEQQEAMSQLYGALADAHDGIVQSIAKSAKNPRLAQDLLDANASYSRYVRIMPDIGQAAAKTVTAKPQMNLARKAALVGAGVAGTYLYGQGKKILGQ